jgi:general secretion pathway protein D
MLTALLLAGCATNKVFDQADVEMQRGNLDTAIAYYQQALLEDPGNTEAKIKLTVAKLQASQQHERTGVALMEAGDYQRAVLELQLAVRLDTANEMAVRKLGAAQALLVEQQRAEDAQLTATERAAQEAAEAPSVVPQLAPLVSGPISFDLRDIAVTEVYRTLAEVAGLNVIFEPTLADDVTTFQVSDTTFEDALRVLTTANRHFTKVLSPNTFMVVPDDITKRREYADQVMRTFYLSNALASTVDSQIRTLLATNLVVSNAELNTVTVRDTPEAIKLIEKLVATADKAVGEILLEVEILEVSSEAVANYGLALEPFGGQAYVAQGTGEDGGNVGLALSQIGSLTSADVFVTIPSLFYQFLRTTTDFKLVAQPKLRAREGETTTLLIGERVPVVTTTFNPQATVGGNIVPVSSTAYEPTGIQLSVLPRVHFNGEITLEIEISVSAVTATATVASVGDLPVFTTRQVSGSIRLKDGETNVIAGLLQDNDIRRRRGIIGLDNVPGLGDALSDTESTTDQTDIVISITPHLLRAAEITAEDMTPVYVGTQQAITGGTFGASAGGGGVGTIRAGTPGAAGGGQDPARPAATVALLPAEHVVVVDEEFAIDVTVNSAEEVFSAGFQLQFDPSVIAYLDYFEGGFLERDGTEVTMQATGRGPGIVSIGMTRMGSEVGVSGGGSLVTLVFRSVGVGTSTIEFSSVALRGALGAPVAVQMSGGQVTVRERE